MITRPTGRSTPGLRVVVAIGANRAIRLAGRCRLAFYHSMRQRWNRLDHPAVHVSDRTIPYGELIERVGRACGWLRERGVAPEDVVALQLPRSTAFLELHLAALASGIATLPLNPAYPAAELAYYLKDSGARLACLLDENAAAVDHPAVVGADALAAELDAAPATHPDAPSPDAVAAIIYTSGTTGRPKGAVIRHRHLAATVRALHSAWRWSDADILVHALPLFHIHGLFVAQHGALWAGAASVWLPRFDADAVFGAIEGHRATVFMGVPTFYHRLLQHSGTPDLSSMRLFTSGSAPLPARVHQAFERRFGHRILERYGMTEIGIVLSNPYEGERRPGAVGFPVPGAHARIADPDTDEARPDGEIGEIQIRGPSVFDGYLGLPDKTAEAVRGGWMHTGDLGMRDADGYFHVVGRAHDMVISGGLNVYPSEVEAVLLEHPAVADVAVVGATDPDLGERVVASVVPASAVDAAELDAWVRDRLAAYKCPRGWDQVEELPRNAMGKVDKAALRRRWSAPRVRRATPADLDAIVRRNTALARETEDLALDEARLRDGVARVLADPRAGSYLMAEVAGRDVGQCMVTTEWSDWRNRPVWWLQSVYVDAPYRRLGAFRALYDDVVRRARRAGAAGIRLYVDRRNERAMSTYAALGMDGEHYRVFEAMFTDDDLTYPADPETR